MRTGSLATGGRRVGSLATGRLLMSIAGGGDTKEAGRGRANVGCRGWLRLESDGGLGCPGGTAGGSGCVCGCDSGGRGFSTPGGSDSLACPAPSMVCCTAGHVQSDLLEP